MKKKLKKNKKKCAPKDAFFILLGVAYVKLTVTELFPTRVEPR